MKHQEAQVKIAMVVAVATYHWEATLAIQNWCANTLKLTNANGEVAADFHMTFLSAALRVQVLKKERRCLTRLNQK